MTNRTALILLISAITALSILTRQTYAAPDATQPLGDAALVNNLVDQLSAADPAERGKAALGIEQLPPSDLGLVQAADKRDDLPAESKMRLHRALGRLEPRIKLRVRRTELQKEYGAWFDKMNADYYDRDGHTNPAWDEAAKKAFAIDATRGAMETRAELAPVLDAEKKELDQAIAAGCDDPGLLTVAGLFATDTNVPAKQVHALFVKAEKSASDGKVSPFIKVIIDGRMARGMMAGLNGAVTDQTQSDAQDELGDMTDRYAEAMKLPGIPAHVMYQMAENVMNTAEAARTADLKPIYDAVYPPLETAVPNDSCVLYLKGCFYVNYAWQARGSGWANTVTPRGWKDFADRLQTAGDTLSKASDLDPFNPDPPTEMLTVVMGQSGDRDTMEKWFKRAMAANPDNQQACKSKMYYLEPKWLGDAESMLKFGHECLDEGNWSADIPFELVDAHIALSKYEQDPNTYYQHPGVWPDIFAVYSAYLQIDPDNLVVKNKYCHFACLCGQWKVANQLFEELGDKTMPGIYGGRTAMRDFKDRATDLGSDAATRP